MVDDTHTRVIYNMWNVACHTYIRSMSLDVIYITILYLQRIYYIVLSMISGGSGGGSTRLSLGAQRGWGSTNFEYCMYDVCV